MISAILLFLFSILCLFWGTGWLVRGSTSLATKMKIPSLVIGLTIIAFGTSIPELIISLRASQERLGDIAVGNIIGSNIYNLCIILGISALRSSLSIKNKLSKLDIPVLILASLLLCYSLWNGIIERTEGISFLSAFVIYVFLRINVSIRQAKTVELIIAAPIPNAPPLLWVKDILFIGCGLFVLIFSSNMIIDNSIIIAKGIGISQSAIAITVIAAASSLPELATSFIAAGEKDPALAVGNVIGSNIFNILCVIGICGTSHTINAPGIEHTDLLFMAITPILLLPMIFPKVKINQIEGSGLIILYIAYALMLLLGIF